jgi:toxin FitB
LLELFDRRVLSFDTEAAQRYAELAVKVRAAGKGFSLPDGYIAATAAVHGFAIATLDAGPFEAAGLPVVNPWDKG